MTAQNRLAEFFITSWTHKCHNSLPIRFLLARLRALLPMETTGRVLTVTALASTAVAVSS